MYIIPHLQLFVILFQSKKCIKYLTFDTFVLFVCFLNVMWLRGLNDLGWSTRTRNHGCSSMKDKDHNKVEDDDAEKHWRLDAGGEQETLTTQWHTC